MEFTLTYTDAQVGTIGFFTKQKARQKVLSFALAKPK